MDNTMDYGADILTLVDDDGVEHQFEVADTMDYEDHQYMALVPVFDEAEELLEDSGELLVLEMVEHDGEGYLEPIADEDLFKRNSTSSRNKACAIPAVFAYKLFYLIQHV